MKKVFISIILILFTIQGYSQFHLNLNGGVNNFTGMAGIFGDYYKKKIGGRGGNCTGGWGAKASVGASFYNFWLSYSNAGGIDKYPIELETISGNKKKVELTLKPAHMIDLTWAKYWGTGLVRFNIEVGYSIRVAGAEWKIEDGNVLSDNAKKVMDFMKPGGLMVGIGLGFKIGK
jgi:hypothetical protein